MLCLYQHILMAAVSFRYTDMVFFSILCFDVLSSLNHFGSVHFQRVLEYCNNPETQKTIMDEIMQAAGTLVLDQYGNYVIQVINLRHFHLDVIITLRHYLRLSRGTSHLPWNRLFECWLKSTTLLAM